MRMILSIRGLYNFDHSIFDPLNFPAGFDKNIFIDYVTLNYAELECLYPSPDYIKLAIDTWSRARQDSWGRIWAALTATYSPIENYDRMEDWTDHGQGENSNHVTDNKVSDGTTGATNDATITNYATSFNSYDPKETDHSVAHSEATGINHNIDNDTITGNGTETRDNHRTGRAHGNIGVTTNQKMINEELDLRNNDFCQIVAEEFKEMFLLEIY